MTYLSKQIVGQRVKAGLLKGGLNAFSVSILHLIGMVNANMAGAMVGMPRSRRNGMVV